MKTQTILLIFLLVLMQSTITFSQETYNDMVVSQNQQPRSLYDAFNQNGQAMLRTQQLAIVYIDFPDGRRSDNGNIPTSYSDFVYIANKDAVGEIGLTTEVNTYPVTYNGNTLYQNPCKYVWADRWNMFFSTNTFLNTAHPDYSTHSNLGVASCSAYGSFKDYWLEVSNNYFEVVPALTHANEVEDMLRTGIVNTYVTLPNGRKIIDYITLPKNKYGTDPNAAYFPNYSYFDFGEPPVPANYNNSNLQRILMMLSDARNAVIQRHAQNPQVYSFDLESFEYQGGRIIFVMAGSHLAFKGVAFKGGTECIVRDMYNNPDNLSCVIDGITNMAHEFAHCALDWGHTTSGRYDIMNVYQTKDINCPSHPNPIFKLNEGWVNPVYLDINRNNVMLDPVETSKQVGIVTIYGNPSAAPDHLSGECFVIENRKRLGFDQLIVSGNPNFYGGLLVWHYSPYTNFARPSGCYNTAVPYVEFKPANNSGQETLCGNSGDPANFFASEETSGYHMLNSTRTYSQENLKTGIELNNIDQTDYYNVNSSIKFDLNYTISEPPQYTHTILSNVYNPVVITTNGNVFFHRRNYYEYYKMMPGTRLDMAPNSEFAAAGIKAIGTETNKIEFGSTGYRNNNESYYCTYNGMSACPFATYSDVDGVYLKYINFTNICNNAKKIYADYSTATQYPIEIENIYTDNLNDNTTSDVRLVNSVINKINIDGLSTSFESAIVNGNINSTGSNIWFKNICSFSSTSNIIFNYCNVYGDYTVTMQPINNGIWNGLQLNGGGIHLNQSNIWGATNGLELNDLTNTLKLENCTFNNRSTDVSIDNYHFNRVYGNGRIYNNIFTSSYPSLSTAHLTVSNSNYILVEQNNFPSINATGINLLNCVSPQIVENTLTGVINNNNYGVVSYGSNGNYNCNYMSQFYEGMYLDNSMPTLFNNYIHGNGIGIYITNNSNPIMTPAYFNNQTGILAGYNHIYDNSGPEIIINNTANACNYIFMSDGYNSIVDDSNTDELILMNNDNVYPEVIKCENNYWGPNDPGSRLNPVQYFSYDPYLTSEPTPQTGCLVTYNTNDNSGAQPQTLMMGSILHLMHMRNYSEASIYADQLVNSNKNKSYLKAGAEFYFINKSMENSNNQSTGDYFKKLMTQYSDDNSLYSYFRNICIKSEILNGNIKNASTYLGAILASPRNLYEFVYASMEKLRLSGMPDKSDGLREYGVKQSLELSQKLEPLLKVKYIESNKSVESKNKNREELRNSNKTKTEVKPILENFYRNLQTNITQYVNNPGSTKQIAINSKILYEILLLNHVENIPPVHISSMNSKMIRNPNINIPKEYSMSQNYPNPFNPMTTIDFALPKDCKVILTVYDITGRELKTLINDYKSAGFYSIQFNGAELSSGVYFYRIQAGNFIKTDKMVLVK